MHQEIQRVPEHAVCAAHEGCGAEGRAGVSAAVYDTATVSIGVTMVSSLFQFDFLIAAKLIHLVSDVVFKALLIILFAP